MTEAQAHREVISLQRCPGHRKSMEPLGEVEVIENLGLTGDWHAREDSSRQVLLLEKETLNSFGLIPGELKENITTSGIGLMSLGSRTSLKIGPEVILELTQECSPCSRMDEIRAGLQRELAGRRGMLARVLRGGRIRRGDLIEVVSHQPR